MRDERQTSLGDAGDLLHLHKAGGEEWEWEDEGKDQKQASLDWDGGLEFAGI